MNYCTVTIEKNIWLFEKGEILDGILLFLIPLGTSLYRCEES